MPPSANHWGYRPHLDGLRAVAVYLVLLFHADIERFAGGFIGVDLFFVLSGYLVTNVILTDLSREGRLRLGRFYARRAKRLIPASFLAVVGTCVVALMVASTLDRAQLVNDATAASLWYANWHFIVEANDYFASSGPESPFLHFWSLAIEEQFYLLFPVALVGLWRLSGRRVTRLIHLLGGLLALGVVVQLAWSLLDANRAYLGTDARTYQLLAGVLLAVWLWTHRLPARPRRAGILLLPLGLAGLVVLSTDVVGVSVSTRGLAATVASVVVLLGSEAARDGRTARALAVSPLRWLGQISYGTYLWHWPVVVLARRVLTIEPVAMFVITAVVGTGLAALSHAVVEEPVRSWSWLRPRPSVAIVGGVVLAVAGGLVVAPALLERDERPPVTAGAVGAAEGGVPVPDLDFDDMDLEAPDVRPCRRDDGSDCVLVEGADDDALRIMVIGDSHARMLGLPLRRIAERNGYALVVAFSANCPWPNRVFKNDPTSDMAERCRGIDTRRHGPILDAFDPDVIIVATRGLAEEVELHSTDDANDELPSDELFEVEARASLVPWLEDERTVVLVEPVPEFEGRANQLECLSRARMLEECLFDVLPAPPERDLYRRIADEEPLVSVLDMTPMVCPTGPCWPIADGDIPVRRDDNHLSNAFGERLVPELEGSLELLGVLP